MTLVALPKHEMYEVGSQIRRSVKSVRSNIVEGYGRRRYNQDFIRFLTYALASCDETRDHLDVLRETKSLNNTEMHADLVKKTEELGKKLNSFIASVDAQHRSVREPAVDYLANPSSIQYPESRIQHIAGDTKDLDS
jgi:four helix bundle protein